MCCHMCPICVIISLSTVLFGFWQRDGYGERERERERGERRLKYIELLKGLPAVHHCHLTHVECEVPSQQPLGGHLLPHTRVHGHSHTHTHTNTCRVTPQISTFKEKKRTVYCCWKRHTIRRICTHSADHLPSLPDSPETLTLTFGLVSTCQTEHALCFVFFLFFFFLKKKKKRQGCLNFHFLDPLASSRSSNALIRDLTWLPMISHQNHP